VDNRENKLKPGMFADIKIILSQQTNVLVVPREALLDEGNDKIAFIKRNGHFSPVLVEVGNTQNHFIEILSGLKEGDIVVTTGNFQLKSKLYDEILKKGHVH
jgi:Cu(I)/Ag(I) efflux system membrane fusion protein